MPLRISHLRLPVDIPESELPSRLAPRLGLKPVELTRWRVLKKSLDARSRNDLEFVYSVLIDLPDETLHSEAIRRRLGSEIEFFEPNRFYDPEPGGEPLAQRPIVVGTGPAGLLAGYYLALKGYRPLIIERGPPVKERVPEVRNFDRGGDFQQENNYLFGEGGAGCFSDGKLTCRLEGPDVDWVLERFVECGGRPSIVYENRPHLGSNKLPMICRNFRRRIEALGGEYRFSCRLESLDIRDGQLHGIHTSSGYLPTRHVVLGIGHSARDTYEMLFAAGVPMIPKAFQLGLRIEQPQAQIDRHKYGRREYRDLLGAADYTLQVRGQKDVFTFCMCAGGVIIPSISEPNRFCTNGMSNSRHDTPFANSGVMVTLDPQEFGSAHPLAGMELQRRYETAAFELGRRNYLCPIQPANDFLARRLPDQSASLPCSYQRGVVPAALDT
ncbi:MAG: FAD-dependent oxidoreductase [Planctomycetaceae bacterium]